MKIRIATINDAEQIQAIYAPYVQNTDISFETVVPTKEELEKRIGKVLEINPWVVLEDGNCILGYAYASKHRERAAYRWAIDVSIYVEQDSKGKGVGKALYTALLSILRLQGYYNAYAGICLPNDSSVGIHEYFGFRKIAHYNNVGYKSGKWHDVGWWELQLKEHNPNPSEPLPLAGIRKEELSKVLSLFT